MVKVILKIKALEELKDILSENTYEKLEKDCRYASTYFKVELEELSDEELTAFLDYLKVKKARIGVHKVQNYIDIKNGVKDLKIRDLQNFTKLLKEKMYDLDRKWIFKYTGSDYLPYFVAEITYKPAEGRGDSFSEAYCYIKLIANTISGYSESSVSLYQSDINGKTVEEALEGKNLFLENEQLLEDFLVQENDYLNEKKAFNKQYKGSGLFTTTTSWRGDQSEVSGNFVNDEEINKNTVTLRVSTKYWNNEEEPQVFNVPCHPYLYVYSLSTYENGYMHISNLKEYKYDDSLRDKLVLPATHRDLLDILSNDLSILAGDIIQGKSTGTTILCKGVPGTGKTLTAEVYSEITHRPLYKVNSVQLGTTPKAVEENLAKILQRAERWGAVMLLDEADTYIRKRGNDMEQNAIVAAFLRTLEYFNGLLFMTTNRIDDVDDAIESRCIAQILYEIPSKENAKRIWKVLSTEFNIALSDELIEALVSRFPEMAGRDIKELLRLTGRFCQAKGYDLEEKHFISCAQFRGIKITE